MSQSSRSSESGFRLAQNGPPSPQPQHGHQQHQQQQQMLAQRGVHLNPRVHGLPLPLPRERTPSFELLDPSRGLDHEQPAVASAVQRLNAQLSQTPPVPSPASVSRRSQQSANSQTSQSRARAPHQLVFQLPPSQPPPPSPSQAQLMMMNAVARGPFPEPPDTQDATVDDLQASFAGFLFGTDEQQQQQQLQQQQQQQQSGRAFSRGQQPAFVPRPSLPSRGQAFSQQHPQSQSQSHPQQRPYTHEHLGMGLGPQQYSFQYGDNDVQWEQPASGAVSRDQPVPGLPRSVSHGSAGRPQQLQQPFGTSGMRFTSLSLPHSQPLRQTAQSQAALWAGDSHWAETSGDGDDTAELTMQRRGSLGSGDSHRSYGPPGAPADAYGSEALDTALHGPQAQLPPDAQYDPFFKTSVFSPVMSSAPLLSLKPSTPPPADAAAPTSALASPAQPEVSDPVAAAPESEPASTDAAVGETSP